MRKTKKAFTGGGNLESTCFHKTLPSQKFVSFIQISHLIECNSKKKLQKFAVRGHGNAGPTLLIVGMCYLLG